MARQASRSQAPPTAMSGWPGKWSVIGSSGWLGQFSFSLQLRRLEGGPDDEVALHFENTISPSFPRKPAAGSEEWILAVLSLSNGLVFGFTAMPLVVRTSSGAHSHQSRCKAGARPVQSRLATGVAPGLDRHCCALGPNQARIGRKPKRAAVSWKLSAGGT